MPQVGQWLKALHADDGTTGPVGAALEDLEVGRRFEVVLDELLSELCEAYLGECKQTESDEKALAAQHTALQREYVDAIVEFLCRSLSDQMTASMRQVLQENQPFLRRLGAHARDIAARVG